MGGSDDGATDGEEVRRQTTKDKRGINNPSEGQQRDLEPGSAALSTTDRKDLSSEQKDTVNDRRHQNEEEAQGNKGNVVSSAPAKKEGRVRTEETRAIPGPDEWITRDERLIRLTGRHPFNAEPPSDLVIDSNERLLTPEALHYVRNHGSVPRLEDESHRLEISGIMPQPKSFTVNELRKKFPAQRILVTFACDGNRRKELNQGERTRGFNFSACAVSTAYWTGALLRDVLEHCGVKDVTMGQQRRREEGNTGKNEEAQDQNSLVPSYVEFEGADTLPHGKYGTSIPLSYALDPYNDVLLAYEMNDRPLPADHGGPLRLILPGCVGGRMVKWLSRVTLSATPSKNWYHLNDNRVYPPSVKGEADLRALATPKMGNLDEDGHAASRAEDGGEVRSPPENSPGTGETNNDESGEQIDWRCSSKERPGSESSSTKAQQGDNGKGENDTINSSDGNKASSRSVPDVGRTRGEVHDGASRGSDEGTNNGEDFVLYQLNVNSAVLSPPHGSIFAVALGSKHKQGPSESVPPPARMSSDGGENNDIGSQMVSLDGSVKFTGFAYSGGGRKVVRVEMTLDDGKSWIQCRRRFPEDAVRHHHKWWAWCIWDCSLPVWRLLRAQEVIVRAWDAAYNTQPSRLTWNLLGMMNNVEYRVKMEVIDGGGGGNHCVSPPTSLSLKFLHPVSQGPKGEDGWMAGVEKRTSVSSAAGGRTGTKGDAKGSEQEKNLRPVARDELQEHATANDCWILIDGYVYDVTSFLSSHPGGADAILALAGQDASEEFNAIHSDEARQMKERYVIGPLAEGKGATAARAEKGGQEAGAAASGVKSAPRKPHVSQRSKYPIMTPFGKEVAIHSRRDWTKVKLIKKEAISHDTRRFTFALPSSNHCLCIPVGRHITLGVHPFADAPEKMVVRPYTPTRPVLNEEEDGTFDLVVKIYFPDSEGRHGGQMSMFLENMELGTELEVKGPEGHITYEGNGLLDIDGHFQFASKINLIGGGTGITPLFQVLKYIARRRETDKTEVALLLSNNREEDILLREEIERMANGTQGIKFWYTLTRVDDVPEGWQYSQGYISREMCDEHLFPAAGDSLTLACGPPGLIQKAAIPILSDMGFDDDHLFIF